MITSQRGSVIRKGPGARRKCQRTTTEKPKQKRRERKESFDGNGGLSEGGGLREGRAVLD